MHAGLRSALFGSALPLAGFEFAADFRNSWHRSGSVVSRDVRGLPTYSFARNGVKWEDIGGVLVMAATNEPLIAPGGGFYVRPPRTNLIPNSRMVGSAAGASPTGWRLLGPSTGADSVTIVGAGVDQNGVEYIDVRSRFDGSQISRRFHQILPSADSAFPAAVQGEVFLAKGYFRKIAGAWPSSAFLTLREFDASNAYTTSTNQALQVVGDSVVPVIATGPIKSASTAKASWHVEVSAGAGEVADVTYRILAPSFGKQATDGQYVPTTNVAVTSGEDRLMFNPPAPVASGEDHITILKANVLVPASATEQCLFAAFNSADTSSYIQLNRYNNGGVSFTSWIAGNIQSNIAIPNVMPGTGVLTIAYIRRGGVNTLAVRVGTGAVQFLARTAVEAWPANLDRMMVGGRVGTVATRFADSAFEFVGVRRGTFTDDQVRTILAAI